MDYIGNRVAVLARWFSIRHWVFEATIFDFQCWFGVNTREGVLLVWRGRVILPKRYRGEEFEDLNRRQTLAAIQELTRVLKTMETH